MHSLSTTITPTSNAAIDPSLHESQSMLLSKDIKYTSLATKNWASSKHNKSEQLT